MIPKTLAEVAKLAEEGEPFDLCLKNFLDGFYAMPNAAGLELEPIALAPKDLTNGAVKDAYLAATAEWLAWRYDLPPPAWAFAPSRWLHKPWFASTLASLRAVLLWESPAPFRSRNLFVSENALSRV
jgi:hypothetical protein